MRMSWAPLELVKVGGSMSSFGPAANNPVVAKSKQTKARVDFIIIPGKMVPLSDTVKKQVTHVRLGLKHPDSHTCVFDGGTDNDRRFPLSPS